MSCLYLYLINLVSNLFNNICIFS